VLQGGSLVIDKQIFLYKLFLKSYLCPAF